jgi:hypothetical protein
VGDAFDFGGKTLLNVDVELTAAGGTQVTLDSKGNAALLHGNASAGDSVILTGDTFTLAERGQLFRNGIETVTDASGTHTNAAPTGVSLDNARVRELSSAGTAVGQLSGADPDTGDILTYTLTDNAGGRFVISGDRLLVADGYRLDFEQAQGHQISIRVTDAGGKSVDRTLWIEITDWSAEVASGSPDADRFVGGAGKDRLGGGGGDDTLAGGFGNDALTGGSGRDVFVFDKPLHRTRNIDTIVGFSHRDDTFWLENKVMKGLKAGKLSKSAFHVGAAAHDANDRIVYDKGKGYLYFDPDGTGSRAAIKFAVLTKKVALDHTDFFVI